MDYYKNIVFNLLRKHKYDLTFLWVTQERGPNGRRLGIDNKELVMEAVKHNKQSFKLASPTLQDDKEIVMAALNHKSIDKYAVLCISKRLLKDRDVVKQCFLKCYRLSLLDFEDFHDDKEIVMIAVRKDGKELKYASDRLKDDDEVVFEAFNQNHLGILGYASERFQDRFEELLEKKKQRFEEDIERCKRQKSNSLS
jgi:hypothetical protein